MSTETDPLEAALENEGDACVQGLKSNFDALLAGIILEILAWSFEVFTSIAGGLVILIRWTPFIGLIPLWLGEMVKP